MVFAAGQTLTAAALNNAIAQPVRYERQSASQIHATATDLQVQFPTVVNSNPDVVASGTGNSVFTVAAGIWLVTASIRCSTATPTREMTIVAGGLTVSGNGSSSLDCGVTGLVIATAATAVSVSTWQSSGANSDITFFNSHLTHVAFARLA